MGAIDSDYGSPGQKRKETSAELTGEDNRLIDGDSPRDRHGASAMFSFGHHGHAKEKER
jgi:hypothetical protein